MDKDAILDESLLPEDDGADEDVAPDRKDAIIFMVDCAEDMFKCREDGTIPFTMCIDAIVSVYKNKIISSDEDLMAVIFYNCKQAKNATNFPGIYVPFPALEPPNAASIKYLSAFNSNNNNNNSNTEQQISPIDDPIPLGNVFWTAANMYGAVKSTTVGSKRIFIFTSNDHPHADNQGLKRAARTRAKDLADFAIDSELFNIQPFDGNKQFDLKPFWGDVLAWNGGDGIVDDEDHSQRFPDSSCKFEELLARIRRRESRKRTLRRSFLTLFPDYKLSIRMYSVFQPARKAAYQWVDAVTNAPLVSKTEYISEETGESLQKSTAKYAFDYGGAKAVLSSEEIANIKSVFSEPGLSLIKFVPQAALKIYHNLAHSIFLFPDDGVLKGSKAAFSALLQSMVDLNVMAICRHVARKGLSVRLVAILPQREELDELGTQLKPAGLVMIPLPYKDDLREPELDNVKDPPPQVSDEHAKAAYEMITKLTLQDAFNPDNYENPALQRHYAYLQALALDEDEPEPVADLSMPNNEMIERRAGHLLKKLHELVGNGDDMEEAPKKKQPTKKAKEAGTIDDEQVVDIQEQIRQAVASGDEAVLSRFTVPQLKAFVEGRGEKAARLKADLVSQLMATRSQP